MGLPGNAIHIGLYLPLKTCLLPPPSPRVSPTLMRALHGILIHTNQTQASPYTLSSQRTFSSRCLASLSYASLLFPPSHLISRRLASLPAISPLLPLPSAPWSGLDDPFLRATSPPFPLPQFSSRCLASPPAVWNGLDHLFLDESPAQLLRLSHNPNALEFCLGTLQLGNWEPCAGEYVEKVGGGNVVTTKSEDSVGGLEVTTTASTSHPPHSPLY